MKMKLILYISLLDLMPYKRYKRHVINRHYLKPRSTKYRQMKESNRQRYKPHVVTVPPPFAQRQNRNILRNVG